MTPAEPHIAIIGAGAIGCVVGGLLTRDGADVTLIDPWPAHVDAMQRHGLRLSGTPDDFTIPVRALHVSDVQAFDVPFDWIFVAVKSYDTDWATTLMAPHLAEDGCVVDFQNGINDDRVAAIVGRDRTLGCVITIGAGLYDPGHAMRTDTRAGGFKVGELDGAHTDRAEAIAGRLAAVAGAEVTANLWGERWAKLAVNCMANPVAGLTGYGSAEVRRRPDTRDLCIRLAAEAIEVGRAHGYEIDQVWGIAAQRFVDAAAGRGRDDIAADLSAGAEVLGDGRPSFLQDVLRKRRTEIDHLNGFVAARGRDVELATPANDAVVDVVHSFPVGALTPDPENLQRVLARLSTS